MYLCTPLWLVLKCANFCFFQKMLRVKDEELSLQERRDNSYHRRRRYSEDYDSEVDLYRQYKAAGLDNNMVAEHLTPHCCI